MRACTTFVLTCDVTAVASTAGAGRTHYGALHGTEVQPERNVELTSWLYEENKENESETRWAIGPMIGLDDRIELGFPLEFAKLGTATTELDRYGAELRYRLVTQDPVHAPPFAPLVRMAVHRVVSDHETMTLEAGLVVSYESGRFHVLADAGASADFARNGSAWTLHPGAGTSIRVIGELRLGAEAFAEIPLAGTDDVSARTTVGNPESESGWLAVGPNLAWTHGRFWLSASYGIGVVGIDSAPRSQWGIAF